MSYIPYSSLGTPKYIRVVKLSISTGAWAAEMSISLATSGSVSDTNFGRFLDLAVYRS